MSLPIGHAAIGFAIRSMCGENESRYSTWKAPLGILILSNLPDVDVLLGIALMGDANIFHRGPTHSLIFAFIGGVLASAVSRVWSPLPKFSFRVSFLLILSHLFADAVFTPSPISLFWPITVNWNAGHFGVQDVLNLILLGNYQDMKIIIGSVSLVLLFRIFNGLRAFIPRPWVNTAFGVGRDSIKK
jgi:membrane-bound metal-dependent hydrolase YbcI (DUF457 family)